MRPRPHGRLSAVTAAAAADVGLIGDGMVVFHVRRRDSQRDAKSACVVQHSAPPRACVPPT